MVKRIFLIFVGIMVGIIMCCATPKQKISSIGKAAYVIRQEGKEGLLDEHGNIILKPSYRAVMYLRDGFIPLVDHHGFLLFHRDSGKILPVRFYDISSFSEGLAAVALEETKKYGYIDATGVFVIQPAFDFAYPFSCGLAVVRSGKNMGIIDREGKFVVAPRYAYLSSLPECYFIASLDEEKFGVIDRAGKVVVDFEYEKFPIVKRKVAFVHKGTEHLVVEIAGNALFKDSSDTPPRIFDVGDERVIYQIPGRKTLFINTLSLSISELPAEMEVDLGSRYDESGFLILKRGGEEWCIDLEGKEVACKKPCQFESTATVVEKISHTKFIINRDGIWGIFECGKGEKLFPQYEEIKSALSGEILIVKKNGRYGIVSSDGEMLVEPQFSEIRSVSGYNHSEDEKILQVKKGKQWGFIENSGKEVIPPVFDEACFFNNGEAKVAQGGAFFIIDREGKVKADISPYRPKDCAHLSCVEVFSVEYRKDSCDGTIEEWPHGKWWGRSYWFEEK